MPVASIPVTSILLTTFQPWKAHQISNSSDDLVAQLQFEGRLPPNSVWLRHVPVSFDLAPVQVIEKMRYHRPKVVVCCGMAEKRPYLSLEQQASWQQQTLTTDLDLSRLLEGTLLSKISYDAGQYVCNRLYYAVLEATQQYNCLQNWATQVIFVHVPVLSSANQRLVVDDFSKILMRLA